jgi:hypothetical protein
MKSLHSMSRPLAVASLAVVLAASIALAQPKQEYQPQVGQEGKDVVWVPTPQALVDRMLDMAKVTADDYLIDLGSGDGRTVITAAKRGAKALGIEYNPNMVELSKKNAAKEGVSNRASFMRADIFQSDFSQATVITLFLLPHLNLQLRPKLLDMKPGTRIVSNTFDMADWQPDDQVNADKDCMSYCQAHFWIVPAKVGGTWKLPQGELTLSQTFQMLTGTLKTGDTVTQISDARMRGDLITFTAGTTLYTGKVTGNTIEGLVRTSTPFKATRGN